MSTKRDFLDEIIDERTKQNPEFPLLVEAALERRALLRKLAEFRALVGLTQQQVAHEMHTSQSAVARIEAGEIDAKLSTVERYASAIGHRVVWRIVEDDRTGSDLVDA